MDQVLLVQEEPMSCSEIIEIPISQPNVAVGQSVVKFPQSQQLKSDQDQTTIIKSIRLITPEVLAFGTTTGLANVPLAEAQKISVLLYAQGWNKGHFIPLLTLNDVSTPGGAFPHRYIKQNFLDWRKVAWDKCTLQYSNNSGGAQPGDDGYCVMFQVEYIRVVKQDDGNGGVVEVVIEGANP